MTITTNRECGPTCPVCSSTTTSEPPSAPAVVESHELGSFGVRFTTDATLHVEREQLIHDAFASLVDMIAIVRRHNQFMRPEDQELLRRAQLVVAQGRVTP